MITCRCGGTTMEILVRRQGDEIVSCRVKFDTDGTGLPGCVPDERTTQLLERRNAAIRGDWLAPRPVYPGSAIVRCACGRDTRVSTSNLSSLDALAPVPDPPDTAVPFSPTACWLSVGDEDGPDTGCAPDWRTWDVLERRRRGWSRPKTDVEMIARPQPVIPDEDRSALATLQFEAQTAPKSKAAKRESVAPTPAFDPAHAPARAAMKANRSPPLRQSLPPSYHP